MENVFWIWSVVNHPNLHGECFWRWSVFGDGVFLEMECVWILIVDNVVWRWSGVFCKWHDRVRLIRISFKQCPCKAIPLKLFMSHGNDMLT